METIVQKIRREYIEEITKNVRSVSPDVELKSLKRLSTGDLSLLAASYAKTSA